MYVLFNHGFDAYLTTKGWKTEFTLKNKNRKHKLIIITKDAQIQKIKDYIKVNSKFLTRGVALIDVETLAKELPQKTIKFSNDEERLMKKNVQQIVQSMIICNAQKVNSCQIFNNQIPKIINITQEQPTQAPPIKEQPTQAPPIKNKKIKTQNMEDLARIKKELRFNKVFIDETIEMTKRVNQIYEMSKEISIYYPKILSEIDGQIQDELHYVEFNKLNMFKAHKVTRKLHKLRIKRRNLKDKIDTANWVLGALNDVCVGELNHVAFKLDELGERRYFIRDPKSFKRNSEKKAEI